MGRDGGVSRIGSEVLVDFHERFLRVVAYEVVHVCDADVEFRD